MTLTLPRARSGAMQLPPEFHLAVARDLAILPAGCTPVLGYFHPARVVVAAFCPRAWQPELSVADMEAGQLKWVQNLVKEVVDACNVGAQQVLCCC